MDVGRRVSHTIPSVLIQCSRTRESLGHPSWKMNQSLTTSATRYGQRSASLRADAEQILRRSDEHPPLRDRGRGIHVFAKLVVRQFLILGLLGVKHDRAARFVGKEQFAVRG